MDRIDYIVDTAIAYTKHVLERAPNHRNIACEHLTKMRDSIAASEPDHPALTRLADFIYEVCGGPPPRQSH